MSINVEDTGFVAGRRAAVGFNNAAGLEADDDAGPADRRLRR